MHRDSTNKRLYIQRASKILEKEGIAGIRVRRLAEEIGCTSAVLYRHFANLEELIVFASIVFMEPYNRLYKQVINDPTLDNITICLITWRAFLLEAYRKYPFYEVLYLGGSEKMLNDCLDEYYELFPHHYENYDTIIMHESSLEKREFLRLRRAVDDHMITLDNARNLSLLTVSVFRGRFVACRKTHDDPGVAEAAYHVTYDLICDLFRKYMDFCPDIEEHIAKANAYNMSILDEEPENELFAETVHIA